MAAESPRKAFVGTEETLLKISTPLSPRKEHINSVVFSDQAGCASTARPPHARMLSIACCGVPFGFQQSAISGETPSPSRCTACVGRRKSSSVPGMSVSPAGISLAAGRVTSRWSVMASTS